MRLRFLRYRTGRGHWVCCLHSLAYRHLIDRSARARLFLLLTAPTQHVSPKPRAVNHADRAAERQPVNRFLRTLDTIMAHHILRRLHEGVAFLHVDCEFGNVTRSRCDHMQTDKQAGERTQVQFTRGFFFSGSGGLSASGVLASGWAPFSFSGRSCGLGSETSSSTSSVSSAN